MEGVLLALRPGGHLYGIQAAWDAMPDYEGECHDSFFVRQEGNGVILCPGFPGFP